MGGAIIRSLAGIQGLTMFGVNRTRSSLDVLAGETGLVACGTIREVARKSDFIVLAVKPQQADTIWPELVPALTGEKCLVSLAAGLTTRSLQESIGHACPVVRAMPNTPALIGEGVTAICLDDTTVTKGQRDGVLEVFRHSGDVHILSESQLDAFTAVIGSGPAFVFHLMESFIDSGVELGLGRELASSMVKKLFSGASRMAEQSDEHIARLREMSISPAGTTIAGLAHMERTAMRGNMIDAIRAAHARSIELGEE